MTSGGLGLCSVNSPGMPSTFTHLQGLGTFLLLRAGVLNGVRHRQEVSFNVSVNSGLAFPGRCGYLFRDLFLLHQDTSHPTAWSVEFTTMGGWIRSIERGRSRWGGLRRSLGWGDNSITVLGKVCEVPRVPVLGGRGVRLGHGDRRRTRRT